MLCLKMLTLRGTTTKDGPVWRVTLVRVKPAQMDAYLTSLRQATKPLLEEEKRTGVIVDYKIFLN